MGKLVLQISLTYERWTQTQQEETEAVVTDWEGGNTDEQVQRPHGPHHITPHVHPIIPCHMPQMHEVNSMFKEQEWLLSCTCNATEESTATHSMPGNPRALCNGDLHWRGRPAAPFHLTRKPPQKERGRASSGRGWSHPSCIQLPHGLLSHTHYERFHSSCQKEALAKVCTPSDVGVLLERPEHLMGTFLLSSALSPASTCPPDPSGISCIRNRLGFSSQVHWYKVTCSRVCRWVGFQPF